MIMTPKSYLRFQRHRGVRNEYESKRGYIDNLQRILQIVQFNFFLNLQWTERQKIAGRKSRDIG